MNRAVALCLFFIAAGTFPVARPADIRDPDCKSAEDYSRCKNAKGQAEIGGWNRPPSSSSSSQSSSPSLPKEGSPARSTNPAILEHYLQNRKAAEQGNADAMGIVGMYLLDGGNGVPKDVNQAIQWLQRSADLGSAEGRHGLQIARNRGLLAPEIQWTAAEVAQMNRSVAEQFRGTTQRYMALAYSGPQRTHPNSENIYAVPNSFDPWGRQRDDYLRGKWKADMAVYGLTMKDLADFGVAVGLVQWDQGEIDLAIGDFAKPDGYGHRGDGAGARKAALEILRSCLRQTMSSDCRWLIQEILRLRRQLIPADVDVVALEREVGAASAVNEFGSLDRKRLNLATHWQSVRAAGEAERKLAEERRRAAAAPQPVAPTGPAIPDSLQKAALPRDEFQPLISRTVALAKTQAAGEGLEFDPEAPPRAAEAEPVIRSVTDELRLITSRLDSSSQYLLRTETPTDCTPQQASGCAKLYTLLTEVRGQEFVSSGANAQQNLDTIRALIGKLAAVACRAETARDSCWEAGNQYDARAKADNPKVNRAQALGYMTRGCAADIGSGNATAGMYCHLFAQWLAEQGDPAHRSLATDYFRLSCALGWTISCDDAVKRLNAPKAQARATK